MKAGKEDITVVLIKSYWATYVQSVVWLATLSACIWLAVQLNSTAMQWVVAIFWFLSVIGAAMEAQKKRRFTLDEAIKNLTELKNQSTD